MEQIATLTSKSGHQIVVNYFLGEVKSLATQEPIDAYIVSTEDGFAPLGSNKAFLSSDLNVPVDEIARLADWNRFENTRVSLIALQSRKTGSRLRGVILAPSESSKCYKQFATPVHWMPYRDYFYNVAYESIAYISRQWCAQNIAVSSYFRGQFAGEDIVTCNAEAFSHFCNETDAPPIALTFLSDAGGITREHLAGIPRLTAQARLGRHRPIATEIEQHEGHVFIHLEWPRAESTKLPMLSRVD